LCRKPDNTACRTNSSIRQSTGVDHTFSIVALARGPRNEKLYFCRPRVS
jgi:hypothetical protein